MVKACISTAVKIMERTELIGNCTKINKQIKLRK